MRLSSQTVDRPARSGQLADSGWTTAALSSFTSSAGRRVGSRSRCSARDNFSTMSPSRPASEDRARLLIRFRGRARVGRLHAWVVLDGEGRERDRGRGASSASTRRARARSTESTSPSPRRDLRLPRAERRREVHDRPRPDDAASSDRGHRARRRLRRREGRAEDPRDHRRRAAGGRARPAPHGAATTCACRRRCRAFPRSSAARARRSCSIGSVSRTPPTARSRDTRAG